MDRAQRYLEIAADVLVGLQSPRGGSRGVLVLGMHRSGTSAITSLIGRLGPELGNPADLMAGDEANQRGYWESTKLAEFQESLLHKLGGGWAQPPVLSPGWESDPRLLRRIGLARRTFRQVYGRADEWVWKDPRTVLLLPFWRRALRFDPIVVGIFRNPLEVADSLSARDGIPKRLALGLWEKYNRALLANARGLPAYVTSYEDLLDRPVAVARDVGRFLENRGVNTHRPSEDVLRSCIDVDLRHNTHAASRADADEDMTDAQHELLRTLRQVRGAHPSFQGLRELVEPELASFPPA
jgi:hypothetical protein